VLVYDNGHRRVQQLLFRRKPIKIDRGFIKNVVFYYLPNRRDYVGLGQFEFRNFPFKMPPSRRKRDRENNIFEKIEFLVFRYKFRSKNGRRYLWKRPIFKGDKNERSERYY